VKKPSSYATLASGARDIDPDIELKEQAAAAILVRWNYVSELSGWGFGGLSSDPPLPPPPTGFMHLNIPGVHVGVGEEYLGLVRDSRPAQPRPSQSYLLSLPSAQLKGMWRQGLERQAEVLAKAEGSDSPGIRVLKDELRTVEKFDAERVSERKGWREREREGKTRAKHRAIAQWPTHTYPPPPPHTQTKTPFTPTCV